MLSTCGSPTARLVVVFSVALAAACGHGTTAGTAPPEPADAIWPEGDFELEADIEYRSQGLTSSATRRVKHKAVLSIDAAGRMQLRSTVGLCRVDDRDNRIRHRRFLCGEVDYDVEPSGDMVSGQALVRAEVMVRGPRTCVQYTTDAQGHRSCVRWDTPMESRWTTLTEPLRVKRLTGGAP